MDRLGTFGAKTRILSETGLTILEAIVALGMSSVLILALLQVSQMSMKMATSVSQKVGGVQASVVRELLSEVPFTRGNCSQFIQITPELSTSPTTGFTATVLLKDKNKKPIRANLNPKQTQATAVIRMQAPESGVYFGQLSLSGESPDQSVPTLIADIQMELDSTSHQPQTCSLSSGPSACHVNSVRYAGPNGSLSDAKSGGGVSCLAGEMAVGGGGSCFGNSESKQAYYLQQSLPVYVENPKGGSFKRDAIVAPLNDPVRPNGDPVFDKWGSARVPNGWYVDCAGTAFGNQNQLTPNSVYVICCRSP